MFLEYGLLGLSGVLVSVTLIPFLPSQNQWVRGWDFPRQQICLLLLAVFVMWIALIFADRTIDYIVLSSLGASFIIQAVQIFPYTPLATPVLLRAENTGNRPEISILIANVLMTNREATRLIAEIKNRSPDIVCLLETDSWWADTMSEIAGGYKETVARPQDDTYGMMLFSKFPLKDTQVRFLVEDNVPSITCLAGIGADDWVKFYALHPRPPRPENDSVVRDAELLMVARELKDCELPAIVAGDLNDVAWSHTTRLFRRISGMLDPRIGRGFYSTFHAKLPFARWPLDHVFADANFKLVEMTRLPAFGADHFPVLARLAFQPEAASKQDTPEPQGDDLEEAKEKIDKAP